MRRGEWTVTQMECPTCGSGETWTSATRKGHNTIRRKRKCHGCGQVFWTVEFRECDVKNELLIDFTRYLKHAKKYLDLAVREATKL